MPTANAPITNHDALASNPHAIAALLESLPPPCHLALRALAEAGRPIDASYLRTELDQLLGASTAGSALNRLERAGLLVTGRHPDSHGEQLGLKPALARSLRELFDAWSDRGTAVIEAPRPLPFAAVILLAHLANARPRLTTKGNLFARDRDALVTRFSDLNANDLTDLYNLLLELCRLHRGDDGRLALDATRVEQVLAASPHELTRMRHLVALAQLRTEERAILASLARWGGSSDRTWLLTAARLREAASREGRRFHWGTDLPGLRSIVGQRLKTLLGADLVLAHDDEVRLSPSLLAVSSPATRRRPSPEPEASGHCIVQPDLTILVPPDEHPLRVFALGRFCELVRFDTLATFAICRASIRNGRHGGLTRQTMRETLRDASRHEVPDNVLRAIDDLAGPDRVAHLVEGITVYIPEMSAQEAERVGLTPTAIPGTWMTKSADRARLLRALAREGIEVSSATRRASTSTTSAETFLDELTRRLHLDEIDTPARPSGDDAEPLTPAAPTATDVDARLAPWSLAAQRLEVRPETLALFSEAWLHHRWTRHARPDPVTVLERLARPAARRVSRRDVRSAAGLLTAVMRDCHCCGAPALLGERAIDSALRLGCRVLVWPAGSPEPTSMLPHRRVVRGGEDVLLGEEPATGHPRAMPLRGAVIALGAPEDENTP